MSGLQLTYGDKPVRRQVGMSSSVLLLFGGNTKKGKMKERIFYWCGFSILAACFLVWVRMTFDILHAMP